jgi:hypothetical protein
MITENDNKFWFLKVITGPPNFKKISFENNPFVKKINF